MGLFSKSETNIFFNQLNLLASRMLDCFIYLERSLDDIHNEGTKDQLKTMQREVKEIHNIIIDDLHNSFITPIDREDIFTLSNSFAEFARYAYSTIDELVSFNVPLDEEMRQMIKNVRKQAEELKIATERLEKNPRVATDHLNLIRNYEEHVEKVYRRAVLKLLQNATAQNVSEDLLKREIYRHIANMSDKAISAAKILGMIVMKLA